MIDIESLKKLDIRALALNDDFGTLNFAASYPKLEEMKKWIIEFFELDYEKHLPQEVVKSISNSIGRYADKIDWIKAFSIARPNPQLDRDQFEREIDDLHRNFFGTFVVSYLFYLKNRAVEHSTDKKELKKQQEATIEAEKRYKELAENLEKKIQSLGEQKQQIETTSGEVAARFFGKSFEAQADEYNRKSGDWLDKRRWYLRWLFAVLVVNIVFYIYLFASTKITILPGFDPKEFFTLEYAAIKLALIALLFYAVAFSSKHYNINSDLMSTNRHRKNVAETFPFFLDTIQNEEAKKEIAKQGAHAMFQHTPNGYTKNSETEHSFINEIINITKQNKD